MRKTSSKMNVHDMVKIDAIVFEIVVGRGVLLKPSDRMIIFKFWAL